MSRSGRISARPSAASFASSLALCHFPQQARQASRLSHLAQLASRRQRDACPTTRGDRRPKAPELFIRRLFRRERIGAVLVEPIQVRGGMRIPPPGFLPMLRRLCHEHEALLILDEIYTGFGRTGRWFACEHAATVPDLICLGKALTGGFPLSACVGRADLMDAAWPPSSGEAIHTSTFLGNPVGCAMALAEIREIEARELVRRSAELGRILLSRLSDLAPRPSGLQLAVRGLGLLAGVEVRLPDSSPATAAVLQDSKDTTAARLHSVARRRVFKRHWLYSAADHFGDPAWGGSKRTRGRVTTLQGSMSYIGRTA